VGSEKKDEREGERGNGKVVTLQEAQKGEGGMWAEFSKKKKRIGSNP